MSASATQPVQQVVYAQQPQQGNYVQQPVAAYTAQPQQATPQHATYTPGTLAQVVYPAAPVTYASPQVLQYAAPTQFVEASQYGGAMQYQYAQQPQVEYQYVQPQPMQYVQDQYGHLYQVPHAQSMIAATSPYQYQFNDCSGAAPPATVMEPAIPQTIMEPAASLTAAGSTSPTAGEKKKTSASKKAPKKKSKGCCS